MTMTTANSQYMMDPTGVGPLIYLMLHGVYSLCQQLHEWGVESAEEFRHQYEMVKRTDLASAKYERAKSFPKARVSVKPSADEVRGVLGLLAQLVYQVKELARKARRAQQTHGSNYFVASQAGRSCVGVSEPGQEMRSVVAASV